MSTCAGCLTGCLASEYSNCSGCDQQEEDCIWNGGSGLCQPIPHGSYVRPGYRKAFGCIPEDTNTTEVPIVLYVGFGIAGFVAVACVYGLIRKVLKSEPVEREWRETQLERMASVERRARRISECSPEWPQGFPQNWSKVNSTSKSQEPVSSTYDEIPPVGERNPNATTMPPQNVTATAYGKDAKDFQRSASGIPHTHQAESQSPRDIKIEIDSPSRAASPDARQSVRSRKSSQQRFSPRPEVPRQARPPEPSGFQSSARSAPASSPPPRFKQRRVGRSSLPIPPRGLTHNIDTATEGVYQQLLHSSSASDVERRAILRELQRAWHPDKNAEEQKEIATAVFQYISAAAPAFLGTQRTSSHRSASI